MKSFLKSITTKAEEIREAIDSSNRLSITLEQCTYLGGDTVIGNVHLSCLVPFNARSILVKMRGLQRARFDEHKTRTHRDHNGNTRTEHYTVTHSETVEFFCLHIPVYECKGMVAQGEYDFPFSYVLPQDLPGSYQDTGGHCNYLGTVRYYAQAKIDVVHKFDLKSKVIFVVNEKFDRQLQPSNGSASKTFMFTSGELESKVWLDKNCYFPGNTVITKVEVNNTSKKPTTRLVMKVLQHIDLRAHGHHFYHSKEIYRKVYPGFEPYFYGVRWLPFQIPVGVQPSTNASRVKGYYTIVIECDIPNAIDLQVQLRPAILAPQWLFSSVPIPPPMTVLPPDVSYRHPWQPDDEAPNCNDCKVKFTVVKRRHHCRACGKVYWAKRFHEKSHLKALGFKDFTVRVCSHCLEKVKSETITFWQQAEELPLLPPQEWGAPAYSAQSNVDQMSIPAYSGPLPSSPPMEKDELKSEVSYESENKMDHRSQVIDSPKSEIDSVTPTAPPQ